MPGLPHDKVLGWEGRKRKIRYHRRLMLSELLTITGTFITLQAAATHGCCNRSVEWQASKFERRRSQPRRTRMRTAWSPVARRPTASDAPLHHTSRHGCPLRLRAEHVATLTSSAIRRRSGTRSFAAVGFAGARPRCRPSKQ